MENIKANYLIIGVVLIALTKTLGFNKLFLFVGLGCVFHALFNVNKTTEDSDKLDN